MKRLPHGLRLEDIASSSVVSAQDVATALEEIFREEETVKKRNSIRTDPNFHVYISDTRCH
eukprot:7162948-Heterocapsa_arctica.AAC.1